MRLQLFVKGLELLQKVAVEHVGRLDGDDHQFIPSELLSKCIIVHECRIALVQKPFRRGIDPDLRKLRHQARYDKQHDEKGFQPVPEDKVSERFKDVLDAVPYSLHDSSRFIVPFCILVGIVISASMTRYVVP